MYWLLVVLVFLLMIMYIIYLHNKVKYYRYDELTGVKTRKDMYRDFIKRKPYKVCFVDIKGLRDLNNSNSYQAGDVLIISVVNILKSVVGSDNIYRLGGDEFVIFVYNKSNELLKLNKQKKYLFSKTYFSCVEVGDLTISDVLSLLDMNIRKQKNK